MDVTEATPLQDVIGSRAKTIALAQKVFGHTTVQTMRAFSQFRLAEDLGKLIEAKREGVFDFGEHVKRDSGSWQWPTAEEAMDLLQGATRQELDNIVIAEARACEEEVGIPVLKEESSLPPEPETSPVLGDDGLTRGQRAALTRKLNIEAREAKKVKIYTARIAELEAQLAQTDGASVEEGVRQFVKEEEASTSGSPLTEEFVKKMIQKIDQLDSKMTTGINLLRDDVRGWVMGLTSRQENVVTGLRGIAGLVVGLEARQAALLEYMDPNVTADQVLPGPSESVIKDLDALTEVVTVTRPAPTSPKVSAGKTAPKIVETQKVYTEEELQTISLADLKKIAQALGIVTTGKNYAPLLVREVQKAQK